ncbi:hypothetical protein [Massilia glaciei]|uniref:Uncharacterized protein n=1 Tax=Massilia glaciei TaxID=1524097 RepID=A0A2U2HHZ8_9BURK|nr:hypothetical protein [Massilia glaciei]PWF45499.1 hypothetical protein C7C56_017280 [Massilia glaciei]
MAASSLSFPGRSRICLSPSLPAGSYALWAHAAWSGSQALRDALARANAIGPGDFEVRAARLMPAGASLVLWSLAIIGLGACWLVGNGA